jgi:hypothetical protein
MPINKAKRHTVQAVLTTEEYERIKIAVENKKRAGYKMTVSKYVAELVRQHLETEKLFNINGNGS